MAWRQSTWRVIADWWSFQAATISLRLSARAESQQNRLAREAGERLRRLFPEHYRHERSAGSYAKHFRAANAEIDIWRAATLLLQKHGDGAELEAARLADLMLDRGDLAGQAVWMRIRRAIVELQAAPSGPLH